MFEAREWKRRYSVGIPKFRFVDGSGRDFKFLENRGVYILQNALYVVIGDFAPNVGLIINEEKKCLLVLYGF